MPHVGLLEAAAALRVGAGERAFLVAEQFRLEQLGGNRRGVQRDEGFRWRGLCSCNARATSSLPVPDSPVMSTATLERDRRADGAEHLLHRRRLA